MNKTTQRGFLWLSLALMIALAGAIFLPLHHVDTPKPIAPTIDSTLTAQQQHNSNPRNYSKTNNRNQHKKNPTKQEPQQSIPRSSDRVYREKPFFTVDINCADTNDLKELRGIGSVYANRIVRYRNRLGGFYCKEQICEVYGITDSLYRTIAPHMTIDSTLTQKIDINNISLDSLKRHPYLDYWQAKAIIQYRNTSQHYREPQDLMLVSLIDKNTFDKIKPYIVCK